MEPRAQGVAHPQAACLLHQDEERRLECILAVVRIVQHALTDAQDHGSVALDQDRKCKLGDLAPFGPKKLEELPIGQLSDRTHSK
jgi:hypothetical protein